MRITSVHLLCFILAFGKIREIIGQNVYSVGDVMLYESNELIYFHVIKPEKVSYVFKAKPAQDFGDVFNRFYSHINLIPVDPPQGCEPLKNNALLTGAIALIERGGCTFLSKAKNAEEAGAIGVFIADNDMNNDRMMVNMIKDDTKREVNIPAGFILAKDSQHIKDALKAEGMYGALITIPVNVTTSPDLFIRQPPWSYW